MASFYKNIILR